MTKDELLKLLTVLQAELEATNRQVEILSDALAESRREVAPKDEALDLALEALEYASTGNRRPEIIGPAITAIKQARSAPVQEPACRYPRCSCNSKDFCDPKRQQALDKKAENARELGLDYEPPCKTGSQCTSKCQQCVVQEPVAWRYRGILHEFDPSDWAEGPVTPLYTTPPAAQRQFVGLTDEEILAANYPDGEENEPTISAPNFELDCFAKQVEAKLKEKNNG